MVVTYLSQKGYETRIQSYKGEIKATILIFSVPKSQNSNEEEKKLGLPHVKDKNSIFTAR